MELEDIFFPPKMDYNQRDHFIHWRGDSDADIKWKEEHTDQGFGTTVVPAGNYALYKLDDDKWIRVGGWQEQGSEGEIIWGNAQFEMDKTFIIFGIKDGIGDLEGDPKDDIEENPNDGKGADALEEFSSKLADGDRLICSLEKSWHPIESFASKHWLAISIITVVSILVLGSCGFACYYFRQRISGGFSSGISFDMFKPKESISKSTQTDLPMYAPHIQQVVQPVQEQYSRYPPNYRQNDRQNYTYHGNYRGNFDTGPHFTEY